jgi:hypothetical protein
MPQHDRIVGALERKRLQQRRVHDGEERGVTPIPRASVRGVVTADGAPESRRR